MDLARREPRLRGQFIPIGGRAFDILTILVRSAGSLVTKDELMARVWPDTIVEESALDVHVSAIRKALGPDRGMLQTTSGRGYRMVEGWTMCQESAVVGEVVRPTSIAAQPVRSNIPTARSELVGRTAAARHLRDVLSAYRVVTLTGPGGIGKTVLTLYIARNLLPTLDGDALVVELVPLSDPRLVPSAVAGVLDLRLGGDVVSAEAVARGHRQEKSPASARQLRACHRCGGHAGGSRGASVSARIHSRDKPRGSAN